jgi:cytoskeletal protein CcmA (bactofilin family)
MQNSQTVTSRPQTFGSSPERASGQPTKALAPSIGAEVTITGNLEAAGDLHIEGSVVGDVRCQTLYLGESGKISGSIQATRVRIAGIVERAIEARDVSLEATARVTGDVTYGRLRVANGASLEGKLKWERPAEVETLSKPIEPSSGAEPAPTPVQAKPAIRTDSPFSRRHHGPKGRAEPIRSPVGLIEQTKTLADEAIAP